jgi:choline kinase
MINILWSEKMVFAGFSLILLKKKANKPKTLILLDFGLYWNSLNEKMLLTGVTEDYQVCKFNGNMVILFVKNFKFKFDTPENTPKKVWI